MPLARLTADDLARYLTTARAAMKPSMRCWRLPTYTAREAGRSALAVATAETMSSTGDDDASFTLMSAIKPFLLLRLLESLGHDAVFANVGKRPSDLPFYSTEQLAADDLRPRNPMLNSGAILLSTLLAGASPAEQCEGFIAWLNALAGTSLAVHQPTLDEMLEGEDGENRRLAEMLQLAGHVADADAAFEVYFRVCCIAGTVADLARLGLLLALPQASISPEHQATTTALCLTCGLYEASAEWAVEVGLPAKSGVSGCAIGIAPGQGSIATFSPWLDEGGNPIAGLLMLRQMTRELGLGVFVLRACPLEAVPDEFALAANGVAKF